MVVVLVQETQVDLVVVDPQVKVVDLQFPTLIQTDMDILEAAEHQEEMVDQVVAVAVAPELVTQVQLEVLEV
jgi:hypothetical protein